MVDNHHFTLKKIFQKLCDGQFLFILDIAHYIPAKFYINDLQYFVYELLCIQIDNDNVLDDDNGDDDNDYKDMTISIILTILMSIITVPLCGQLAYN